MGKLPFRRTCPTPLQPVPPLEILRVLDQDVRLRRQWISFARKLGLPESEIQDIRKQVGSTSDTLFEVIQCWIGCTGKAATLKTLVTNLDTLKFKLSSDLLKEKYPKYTEIRIDYTAKMDHPNNDVEIAEEAYEKPDGTPEWDDLCDMFSKKCDTESYDMTLKNIAEPKYASQDEDKMNEFFSHCGVDLGVERAWRSGAPGLKPRPLKVKCKSKKNFQNGKFQKQIAKFTSIVREHQCPIEIEPSMDLTEYYPKKRGKLSLPLRVFGFFCNLTVDIVNATRDRVINQ